MTGQSTLDESAQDTNAVYRRTLHVLSDAGVPFLVGGSHAFLEYTGIVRNTKDFDLFLRRPDLDRAMRALHDAGYRTERGRLAERFGDRWPLLYTYLVFFTFVYPSDAGRLPAAVMDDLAARHL